MLIKPAYSATELPQPQNWQALVCGDYMQQQTQRMLDQYSRRLRCGTTLGLGGLADGLNYQRFCLTKPVVVSPVKKAHTITAKLEALPIKQHVVDQVIMPFVLEYSRDPHQLLREVNRVLVDDGYIFMSGFNPLSPAMLSGWLPANRKKLPWSGRYFSALRVKDWLSLLGYEIVQQDYYMGRFLLGECDESEAQGSLVWTEKLCHKIPVMHCGYALLARKCVAKKATKLDLAKSQAMAQRPVATARSQSSLMINKEVLDD